jgi:hypothetical protein
MSKEVTYTPPGRTRSRSLAASYSLLSWAAAANTAWAACPLCRLTRRRGSRRLRLHRLLRRVGVRYRSPVYAFVMPTFDIAFMRVDRDKDPTLVERFVRTVDWPVLPREGEGLDISEGLDSVTAESVGFDFDGYPTVFVGRVVLDDLQTVQLRKLGWRVRKLPFGRR